MSNAATGDHSFSPARCLCRYEDYKLLLNDSSPQVENVLPFQEVKVESVVPFQELGASYTFCCVAINRVGNDSDKFHSLTITSKIQTGGLGGRENLGALGGPSAYMYIPIVLQER